MYLPFRIHLDAMVAGRMQCSRASTLRVIDFNEFMSSSQRTHELKPKQIT